MRALILGVILLLQAPSGQQDTPESPEAFTEVESLRIQNVNLEGALLDRQMVEWRAKVTKLKVDIEAKRPHWIWNPETGTFTKRAKP